MNFEIPAERSSIIKVIGVGGGGGNAVNYMYNKGIKDVNFVVCNTDAQALSNSPVPVKIQLGETLTEGRGAGNKPETGKQAAIENLEDVVRVLEDNTKMIFVTAGMGGGTGTGAAPIIAKAAHEMGILTVGIVTIPFRFEGEKRITQALDGIAEIKKHVDALLIINNEKLRDMYGDLKLSNAFAKADDVLATAAKGIAEIITVHGYINVDFADVETVMKNSGVAIMGSASAEGENRAIDAIQAALDSPLLNNYDISGVQNILLNITSGKDEITMDEVGQITDFVQDIVGANASIIWGTGIDEKLGNKVNVTIIATGFGYEYESDEDAGREGGNDVIRIPLDGFDGTREKDTRSGKMLPEENMPSGSVEPKVGETITFDLGKDKDAKREMIDELYRPVIKKTGGNSHNAQQSVPDVEQVIQPVTDVFPDDIEDDKIIEQMENVPAYKRRGFPAGRQESEKEKTKGEKVSRFSLIDDPEKGVTLRKNNPYLHDNVD
ncbi:MAG: cell division protein FtsZ [Chlorobi bacterium]|nr:cell division protein FtsZ [Chlorobiota bacterium]